jgi:hypothetical protein
MGYAIAMGQCLACRRVFSFNPVRVPSLHGEPVCESCMALANERRVAAGVPPHPIHPEAYGPCNEAEL